MSEITISASGSIGSGKSAILGEIEILCKALGLEVRYANAHAAQSEKNMTHADWTTALEMYKPTIVLREINLNKKENSLSWLDGQEFYEACQIYRTAPANDPRAVMNSFKALQGFVRRQLQASEPVDSYPIPEHLRQFNTSANDDVSDTQLLDAIWENYWDLTSFDIPTGQGDASIGWRVCEQYHDRPTPVTKAEIFEDDPRKVIALAIKEQEKRHAV